MQQFASPSSEMRVSTGINLNMISPIPNREGNNLGGASVNRYVEVSHDQSQIQK